MANSTDAPSIASFDHFMESVREPGVSSDLLSLRRFGETLQIDLLTLAGQAGVDPNTVELEPQSDSIQCFLRSAVRVIKAASELSGDPNKALSWYRTHPLQPFHNVTAEQMVANGKADAVVKYISMLEAGAAG